MNKIEIESITCRKSFVFKDKKLNKIENGVSTGICLNTPFL